MSTPLILVTGANGGVAQHVVQYLLAHGQGRVLCHYRGQRDQVDATFDRHGVAGTHAYQADLCDEASVMAMRDAITRDHGAVDVLINVAGSSSNGMCWKLETSDVVRVLHDSVLSTFLCTKAFLPAMREARNGRIVNVSSIVGATGVAGASHYAAAKAAIVGFSKSVAQEVANRGVTVNALALGYFDTGMIHSVPEAMQEQVKARIPTGRFGGRDDVGAAVSYLMSPEAAFVTGQVLHINGGQY